MITIGHRVAALKNEGKSLQETIAAKPTAAYDSKQAGSFIMGDVFTKLVWVPEPDFSFILPGCLGRRAACSSIRKLHHSRIVRRISHEDASI